MNYKLLAGLLWVTQVAARPILFYVSPDGSDHWSGRLASGTASHNDGPFASLDRARQAVRQELQGGGQPDLVVEVRAGLYPLSRPLLFAPEDSGQAGHPVIFRNYPGEHPELTSTVPVTGWQPLKTVPAGLPREAVGKLWWAPLNRSCKTLYQGTRRLPRAATGPHRTCFMTEQEARDCRSLAVGAGLLGADTPRADLEVVVQPAAQPWVMNILQVSSGDLGRGLLKTRQRGSYPLQGSVWLENCWEGMTRPGSWLMDSANGRLVLWPPEAGREPEQISLPRLTCLLGIEGDYVHIEGLTLRGGERETWRLDDVALQHDWDRFDRDNALIRLRGADHCSIQNCTLEASGGGGIRLDLHCQDNLIADNHLRYLGGTGILLSGYGPGTKDENKGNRVERNDIHHIGELYWHSPGIFLWQSGQNRVAHNRLHHLPYSGIVLSGVRAPFFVQRPFPHREQACIRWGEVPQGGDWDELLPYLHCRQNRVEDNEIFRAVEKLGDGNAIYLSGTGGDNLIRHNYLHHLSAPGVQSALRCDDYEKGDRLEGNVVYACACPGVTLKYATRFVNNFLIDLKESAYLQLRTGRSEGCLLARNIFLHPGKWQRFYDVQGEGARLEDCVLEHNLYFTEGSPDGSDFLRRLQDLGVEAQAVFADPCFIDPAHANFGFQARSPAPPLGIQSIDLKQVGLDGPAPSASWAGPADEP